MQGQVSQAKTGRDPDVRSAARIRRAVTAGILALLGLSVALATRTVATGAGVENDTGALLLVGGCALAGVVFLHAAVTFSLRAALALLGLSMTVSWVFEHMGQIVPFPFSATYTYHHQLAPRLGGTVPLFICLGWFVLSYGPLLYLARYRPERPGARWGARLVKASLCSVALLSNDLCLDPLCVAMGLWTWQGGGVFYGVPVGNFLGWFVVGMLIYFPFLSLGLDRPAERMESPGRLAAVPATGGLILLGLTLVMAIRHVRSATPALAAAAVQSPFIVVWIRNNRRGWMATYGANGRVNDPSSRTSPREES